jgi:signal transduction histidine kinase
MDLSSKISELYSGILNTGTEHSISVSEQRRIRGVNISYLSAFLFVLAYAIAYSMVDAVHLLPVIILLIFTLPFYFIVYFVIRSGKTELAKHVLCFLIPLPIIAVTYFYFGREINLQFFLLAFSFFPPMLWGTNHFIKIFLYQFIYLVVFTYLHFGMPDSQVLVHFPVELRATFSAVSLFASLGTIATCLYTSIRATELNEKELLIAKEKAEESNRLKTQFLANMSHEIRTPLNGILGFLLLLKENDLTEEERTKYIELMNNCGDRLLDTINDIILMSKIETGIVKPDLAEFNIGEMLNFLNTFFKSQSDSKGLEFRFVNHIPQGKSYILCDRNKLEGILSNLIKNAIKFTTSGYVELESSLKGKNMIFRVKDTGKGIPAGKLNVIFERFVQADMSIARSYEGSGLGLAIAKAYAGMLNAGINVESVEGKGSVFTVSVPYIECKTGSVSVPYNETTANEPAAHFADGFRILVAEDDEASYLYLNTILERTGIECIRTCDGPSTIKALSEDKNISMVLMDIKLPVMDGLNATREIRKFNNEIPIIAQTAYALEGDREKAIEAGCNAYLSKPVRSDDLLKIIKSFRLS